MLVGLPAKKCKFQFMGQDEVYGGCVLVGSELIVGYNLINSADEEKGRAIVKKFDLNNYNGDENLDEYSFESEDLVVGSMRVDSNLLLLTSGKKSCILDKNTWNVIFVDKNDLTRKEWRTSFASFVRGLKYFRQIDRDNLSLGFDVIDLETSSFSYHLDVDFAFPDRHGDDLLYGIRENGNPAIYSLAENRYLLELDLEQYFDCTSKSLCRFHIDSFGNRLVFGYNKNVVVVDLRSFEVVNHIDCLKIPAIEGISQEYKMDKSYFKIMGLSVCENFIVVHGDPFFPFVMCLDARKQEQPCLWVYTKWYEIMTKYIGGDLIFGLEDKRPSAWDVYTGEKVWEGSRGTIANEIEVGDGWVVYSQFSGHIDCYQWKKPYLSPHRPADK